MSLRLAKNIFFGRRRALARVNASKWQSFRGLKPCACQYIQHDGLLNLHEFHLAAIDFLKQHFLTLRSPDFQFEVMNSVFLLF